MASLQARLPLDSVRDWLFTIAYAFVYAAGIAIIAIPVGIFILCVIVYDWVDMIWE